MSENDNGMSNMISVLDLLNFKVAEKEPGDPGYYSESNLPSECHLWRVECLKQRDLINQWREWGKERHRYDAHISGKMEALEKENTYLKSKIAKMTNDFILARDKLIFNQKTEVVNLKSENREKQKNINKLEKRNRELNEQCGNLLQQTFELEQEVRKSNQEKDNLQTENEQLKNKVAEQEERLKMMEKLAKEQSEKEKELEKDQKTEVATLTTKINDLKMDVQIAENVNGGLDRDLVQVRKEKWEAVEKLNRLSAHLAKINDELEENIDNFVKSFLEVTDKSYEDFTKNVGQKQDQQLQKRSNGDVKQEERLQTNLDRLSTVIRDILEECLLDEVQDDKEDA